MPETPKNNLEKLLSDYAEQRRNAAGTPELHPATRRMLQSEVKRHLGTPEQPVAAPQPAWWVRLWPRIALASGVCAVLGIVVFIAFPPSETPRDNLAMARVEGKESPAAAPAPVTLASGTARDEEDAAVDRSLGTRTATSELRTLDVAKEESLVARSDSAGALAAGTDRPAAPALQPTPTALPAMVAKGGVTTSPAESSGTRTARMSDADASNQPKAAKSGPAIEVAKAVEPGPARTASKSGAFGADAKASAPGAASLAVNNQARVQNALTQRFRNYQTSNAEKDKQALAILDEFTVELNGNEMKIVDRDGSDYNGYVEAAPVPATQSALNYAARTETNGLANLKLAGRAGGEQAATATLQQQAIPVQRFEPADGLVAAQFQAAPEAQNFNFRVEGTNRTLKQSVVITGNLIQNDFANARQNELQATQQFRQQQIQQAPFNQNLFRAQIQNNYIINGRVVLGNSKTATELNALSVDGQ